MGYVTMIACRMQVIKRPAILVGKFTGEKEGKFGAVERT
jgi:hypothetical protein